MRGNENRYDQRNNESIKKDGFELKVITVPTFVRSADKQNRASRSDWRGNSFRKYRAKKTGEASLKKTATTPERFRGCNAGN